MLHLRIVFGFVSSWTISFWNKNSLNKKFLTSIFWIDVLGEDLTSFARSTTLGDTSWVRRTMSCLLQAGTCQIFSLAESPSWSSVNKTFLEIWSKLYKCWTPHISFEGIWSDLKTKVGTNICYKMHTFHNILLKYAHISMIQWYNSEYYEMLKW